LKKFPLKNLFQNFFVRKAALRALLFDTGEERKPKIKFLESVKTFFQKGFHAFRKSF
jgi:hypothetical protein